MGSICLEACPLRLSNRDGSQTLTDWLLPQLVVVLAGDLVERGTGLVSIVYPNYLQAYSFQTSMGTCLTQL